MYAPLRTAMELSTAHTIVVGDARSLDLPDSSVHMVVTSPPYWSLKDYGDATQIGCGQTYDEYLEALQTVFAECFRVLHGGCRIAVNVGDQFMRATRNMPYHIKPIAADVIQLLRACGFTLMGNIIWHKITNTAPSGGGAWMGSLYYPRDGHVTYEHEYIILARKPGLAAPPPTPKHKAASRLSAHQRSTWFRGLWRIPPASQRAHPAAFPLPLPLRLITMYTYVGETVLDPFLGSGTTALAAALTGRSSVGYEINPRYAKQAATRLFATLAARVRILDATSCNGLHM